MNLSRPDRLARLDALAAQYALGTLPARPRAQDRPDRRRRRDGRPGAARLGAPHRGARRRRPADRTFRPRVDRARATARLRRRTHGAVVAAPGLLAAVRARELRGGVRAGRVAVRPARRPPAGVDRRRAGRTGRAPGAGRERAARRPRPRGEGARAGHACRPAVRSNCGCCPGKVRRVRWASSRGRGVARCGCRHEPRPGVPGHRRAWRSASSRRADRRPDCRPGRCSTPAGSNGSDPPGNGSAPENDTAGSPKAAGRSALLWGRGPSSSRGGRARGCAVAPRGAFATRDPIRGSVREGCRTSVARFRVAHPIVERPGARRASSAT